MRIARVVKGRATEQLEGELATHDAHGAYDAVVLRVFLGRLDRHEIGDLTDTLEREKARDQDIGLWQIVLLVPHLGRSAGCNAIEAAFFSIQQSPKDAGCIKSGDAAPVNRAIFADKSDRMKITDDPMVLNWQVGSCLRMRLNHVCYSYLSQRISCFSSTLAALRSHYLARTK